MEFEDYENRVPCYVRIKEGLELRDMTIYRLAQLTGLTKSAIYNYASGKFEPKQSAIYLISKALDVCEPWLMGFNVPKERVTRIEKSITLEEKELLELYAKLPTEKKQELRKYLDYLLNT